MNKTVLTVALVLSALAMLLSPTAAFATNSATQSASISAATTISIKAQDYTTDVATITFPSGAPGATVSNPGNDHGDTQAFSVTPGSAHPVVTLLNGGGVTYTISYQISSFTNSVVASEGYLINAKGAACADAAAVTGDVVFDTLTSTAITIDSGAGNEKDLYLKITLGTAAGKTGTSTITILGES